MPVRTLGQDVLHTTRETYHELISTLRDQGYSMLSDLCGVDYLTHPGRTLPPNVVAERFEVVAELLDLGTAQRLRVRVQVPESDPLVESIWDLFAGAEAMEREAFDMFGIEFSGHPDLTRILMPHDWEGHPLRKDFSVGRVPVQFKEAPGPR